MTNVHRLVNLFRVITEEARTNPAFADRLALAWEGERVRDKQPEPRGKQKGATPGRGRRRAPAVLDPLVIYRDGEEALRTRLGELNMEELKDIVAEHGMDSRKLAMKWKTPDRLIDLIVETVRERVTKGNVFRHSSVSSSRVVDVSDDRQVEENRDAFRTEDAGEPEPVLTGSELPMRDEFGFRYPLTREERQEHHRLRVAADHGGGEDAAAELAAFEGRMDKKYALDLPE
jgi:hypothetical protein